MGYDPIYACRPLGISEAFGYKVRFAETGPIADPLPLTITRLENINKLSIPDVKMDGRLPVILETVRLLRACGGGKILVLGMFKGSFTATCRILEPDLIMRMTLKNRQALESLLDKVNEFLLVFGLALIGNGANIFFIAEPTASASMI